MEPSVKELYDNMKAAGFISEAVSIDKFAAGVATEAGQRKLYSGLAAIQVPGSPYGGAGLPEDEFMSRFFSKKKVQTEPSPVGSDQSFPDFSGISSSPNAPAPTATEPSTSDPQQQPQPTDGGLPSNLIPAAIPRDATVPQPQVDRGAVKPYSISGNEPIAGYALQKNAISRKDSQADAVPSMETPMSSGNSSDESKAAMVYAEDARRQADIATTQLEQAFGPDWRQKAPANDPDRIKLDAAVKAQARAYDYYQAHTGGTTLDGTEDPIAFGENRRKNLPSYDYKKTYDSKTALRGEKRKLDNISEYGEAARFQTRFSDTLLKEKYGEDWQANLNNTITALGSDHGIGRTPENMALYQQITSDPNFIKWSAGSEAQSKGYEAFKAQIEASPAQKQRMLESAASQQAANQASADRPGPEALAILANPMIAANVDPLSKNWAFRKAAQLIGAAASLPRTVGRGISGKDDGWKVADEIGSWADDLVDKVDSAYPKPEQMSRPLYERVTQFDGKEAIVDNKGNLKAIRGKDGQNIEITPEMSDAFEASGAADKANEQFNGATATADKVLDAAADLMLYRFMGGGSKMGVVASSFYMQHQQAYQEAASQLKMSAGDASQYALVTATLNGVLEAYVGDIETAFAKPGVASAVKAGKKEAMLLAGKQSGAQVAIAAIKPVIKEVAGENSEEVLQAIQDYATRAAYNNMTGANLEEGQVSKQDLKETILVTTLLTAPAAALGISAHTEANRRTALLSAVKDPAGFENVLAELEKNKVISSEKASDMKEKIQRLSALNSAMPESMTDDQRSHVLALQEFSDKKAKEAAAPDAAPAIASIAKQDAKEADAVIESMVKDEKANPTPVPETVPEKKPKKDKKVADVVVSPEDTPDVVQEKTNTVAEQVQVDLQKKGVVVTPEILSEATAFVAPEITNTPFASEQQAPLSDAVSNSVDDFVQEKGIDATPVSNTPVKDEYRGRLDSMDKENKMSDTANLSVGDFVAVPSSSKTSGVTGFVKSVGRTNVVIETFHQLGSTMDDGVMQEITIKKADIAEFLKPNVAEQNKVAKDFGLDEQQSVAYEEHLPAISEKVAALSDKDVQDANDFVQKMGNDLDRVIASVNGSIEEMDRQAFEELKKKNPTVHQLFFDELSSTEDSSAIPGSGQGQEVGVQPAKTAKASTVNEGQDVGAKQTVPGGQGNADKVQRESDTGGLVASPIASTSDGKMTEDDARVIIESIGRTVPPTMATSEGAVEAAASGLITPEVAVRAVSGNEKAQQAVVDAGPKIEATAEASVDIQDATEGKDFQEISDPNGGMTPISSGIFVTRGDIVYVSNSTGFEDVLRGMGGNLVPGKGWAFPLADKWKVAAAMKRTAIASARDKSNRKNSGDDGRASAALGDHDILVTAKKTEKAIAEGKTLQERVAAAKDALHVQENERKDKVLRTIERLKPAFPNITVVTDPSEIAEVLRELKIKDAPAGFKYKGKVYIDLERAGVDTAIHEFGHIWSDFLRVNKPKVYQEGLEIMKGTEYEAVVREDDRYTYLEEDEEVLDEALSQAYGERGARLGEEKDWAAFKAFMARAKTAIKNALGFDPMKMSAKQYADTMAAKMLSGDVLMEETSADIAKLEEGVKFMFAGKSAAEIDKDTRGDLFTARYMEKKGHSPRDIWHSTNWWRGPDGHWRFEVADKGAEVVREISLIDDNEVLPLGDVMSHPELYKIYPGIKDLPVVFVNNPDATWFASAAMSKDGAQYIMVNKAMVKSAEGLRRALLHEAQHAVQYAEGFGIGMKNDANFASTVLESNLAAAVQEKDVERIKMLYKAVGNTVGELYQKTSGEAESRNVEARADNTDRVFPEDTMDVAPAEQVVLFMTDSAFDKVVHGFDGAQSAPSAKFQHAANTLREAAVRAAAKQLVDIEVKTGGMTKEQVVPFIAKELGLDEAVVDSMWEDAAHKYAPKNMIDTTKSGVSKSITAITTKLGKWVKKWIGTYRNLPREVFRSVNKMQHEISAEMYAASKIGDDLSRALKKYPPEMAGIVQNVLEGNADWSLLPDDLAIPAMALRNSVDALSRKLLLCGAVKKGTIIKVMENMGVEIDPDEEGLVDDIEAILGKPPLERTDEEIEMIDDFLDTHKAKMGTYLNRSYRAHQYKDWGDKTPEGFKRVPPEAVDQARKFFVKKLQEDYKKLVEKLGKVDEKAAKKATKIGGLISDGYAALSDVTDPAEILSRTNEIGALQRQLDKLQDQTASDKEAIAARMDEVSARLGKIDDEVAGYLYKQKTDSSTSPTNIAGKKNESVLARKDDVPEELRALLGEYRDPVVNYATTVAKIAHLMAAQDFLNDMKSRYGGIYFHEGRNSPAGNYVKVSMSGDPAFGPIDGWWTTPDILEALKDMRTPEGVSQWERNWAAYVVQGVKLGKTILSPITHARNFIGNIAFSVMNGWSPVTMYKAFKEMAPMFNDGDKSKWRAYAEKLHRLGVFGESVSAGDLEALRTYASWDAGSNEVARYAKFTEKIMHIPSKIYDVAKTAYELEDNFYRMMSFENEKRRYAQAYYNKEFSDLSLEELSRVESKAAEITSHILPTYSYVPRLVQAVRRMPFVGTFVAFPSEMVRVSYNNIEQGVSEMKDSRTRAFGIKRLMGAALVHSAEFWLLEIAKSLAGYDDKEWENANEFVAPFEKNGALLPLPRDNKGQMGYINLSYTNPYSFIPKAYRAFVDDPKASVAESTVSAAKSLLDPFTSPELSFMALNQLFMNQDDWGRPIRQDAFQGPLGSTWLASENIGAQMRFLSNKLQPGIIKSVRDAYDIAQQNPSRSGKVKAWDTFALSHVLGLSIQRIDPTFSYGNQMYRLADQRNQARKNYTAAQKRYNAGYTTVERENAGDSVLLSRKDTEFKAEMQREYEVSKSAYARILQDAVEATQALRALGIKDSVIRQNMGGFSNAEKSAILSGQTNLQLTFKRKGRY